MRSFSSPSSEATSVARTMALRDGSPCGAATAASTPWSRATSWRNPARRRNAAPPAYWAKPDAPNTMGSGGKDEGADEGVEDGGGSGGDPGARTAPRVGTEGVPGADADGGAVRRRATRCGMRASARDRQPDASEREGDLEERAGEGGAGRGGGDQVGG